MKKPFQFSKVVQFLLILTAAAALTAFSGSLSFITPLKGDFNMSEKFHKDSVNFMGTPELFSLKFEPWADSLLASMTLEEKIGQMIFPDLEPRYLKADGSIDEELISFIKDMKAGGFVLFALDRGKYLGIYNKLQEMAGVPLLIGADFEFGVPMRFKAGTAFPYNMGLGAADDSGLVYEMGRVIAEESRAMGVHFNYAPVSDVNSNPYNPIVNVRSIGEDPDLTGKLTSALIRGMQDNNLLTSAKHFPGHGNTTVDSHNDIAVIEREKDDFYGIDVTPFRHNINSGAMAIMVGHLGVKALGTQEVPASISPKIITDLLIKELGFKGLVVTDAMNMKAITKYYKDDEAAVMAVNAGIDALLYPHDEWEMYNGLINAVKQGRITEERINRSVRKILLIKRWLGLNENKYIDQNDISILEKDENNQKIAYDLARKSITLLRYEKPLLPLKKTKKYFALLISDNEFRGKETGYIDDLKKSLPYLNYQVVYPKQKDGDYGSVMENAAEADYLLISVFNKWVQATGAIGPGKEVISLIKEVEKLGKPTIFISHGNPYILSQLDNPDVYMSVYGVMSANDHAIADALLGKGAIGGKIPVTIPNSTVHAGFGLYLPADSVLPQREFNFSRVDELVNKSVKDSVFPGGSLVVFYGDEAVYKKSYGRLVYADESPAVTQNTIYDLASLTKVIATTTASMILFDRGKLDIEKSVAEYLLELKGTDKEIITVRNLLTHESGFPAFKRFYQDFKTADEVIKDIYLTKLAYKPGSKTVYSDLGVILLGKIIERISGKTLDAFVTDEVFKPLGMSRTFYNPASDYLPDIAPTEQDNYWRMRLVRGTVHDEAAAMLNGVAGHAGLFSDAADLSKFMKFLADGGKYDGKQIVKSSTIDYFTARQSLRSSRGLGWDTKTDTKKENLGKEFSNFTFGHTGFTGTSFFYDREKRIGVIFLSNRVYPTRENTKIIQFRKKLHEAVIKAVLQ
ncbi:MAG: serine hydrolase [Ignavibacteriaceae bacterium]|nr:serine hydrolase [Ignavibacteriaceae bacterium]